MGKPVCDCRIDRIFGDITFGAEIVIPAAVLAQRASLHLHLVGSLPATQRRFTDTAHGLRIRRHHRKHAQIMENVFGGDGFAPDAGFRECHILGDFRTEMVTDHQHIEMFIDRVDGVGAGRIG